MFFRPKGGAQSRTQPRSPEPARVMPWFVARDQLRFDRMFWSQRTRHPPRIIRLHSKWEARCALPIRVPWGARMSRSLECSASVFREGILAKAFIRTVFTVVYCCSVQSFDRETSVQGLGREFVHGHSYSGIQPPNESGSIFLSSSRRVLSTCRSESNEPTFRANCSQWGMSTERITRLMSGI